MKTFMLKNYLRTISVFASVILLKFVIDGFLSYDDILIRIICLIVGFIGIPFIFMLVNLIANRLDRPNK